MAKRELPLLSSKRVRLRLLTAEDLPMTLFWRNQDDIRCWFVNSEIIQPGQHHEWFTQYEKSENDFIFIIEDSQVLNRSVGQISLYDIDWEARSAEFGRLMIGNQASRGQGIASEATKLLLDFAFSDFGLRNIRLEVFRDNLPALAVYRACGFVVTKQADAITSMVRTADTSPGLQGT